MDDLETIDNRIKACQTAFDHELDAVFVLNGHGGNGSLVDAAVNELGTDHPNVRMTERTYFTLVESFVDEIRDGDHGGEFDTSHVLHLHDELVGENREAMLLDEPFELGDNDLVAPGLLPVSRSFDGYSASGAIGDPNLASAA